MLEVLVVDDSVVARSLIVHIIDREPGMRVVGQAADGLEAQRMVDALHPDVVTMDIQMPFVDGYQATAAIMAATPVPIVLVSAHETKQIERSFRAIDAGAMMVLRKPDGLAGSNAGQIANELVTAIRAVAGLSPGRARHGAQNPTSRGAPASALGSAHRPAAGRVDLVAIGASTGGPAALSAILRGLPANLEVPIVIVQHIADGFDAGFAKYLDAISQFAVRLARDGEVPQPGDVLIAPNGSHLTMAPGGRVKFVVDPPISGHRPSVTALFRSVAQSLGAHALGVILTGIGRDGCEGLADLRAAGGRVIAQDRDSSVVWGMPGSVVAAGLADQVLALESIAPAIVQACRRGRLAA